MKQSTLRLILIACISLVTFAATVVSAPAASADDPLIRIEIPGAEDLEVRALNNLGVVTGDYRVGSEDYGFVRSASGIISTFQIADSFGMSVGGINDAGTVVGDYYSFGDRGLEDYVFVRSASGVISTFVIPDIESPWIQGITDAGAVIGSDLFGGNAFVRHADGSVELFGAPGADATYVYSVAASGHAAGVWRDADFNEFGFVRSPSGVFETFGSGRLLRASVNNNGDVAGSWDLSGRTSSFVRTADGSTRPRTGLIEAINNHATVAGYSPDVIGRGPGFTETIDGVRTYIDVPFGTSA